jgi:hypothetical protein
MPALNIVFLYLAILIYWQVVGNQTLEEEILISDTELAEIEDEIRAIKGVLTYNELCMERRPKASVRKTLREEVRFGCPVDKCGSPYLTWHHFDPPWRIEEHQNVSGMVALCAEHHKKADAGAFTKDQIRGFKTNPFLANSASGPEGVFDWRREQLLVRAGQMKAINCPVLLELAGRPAIWLSKDDLGHELLNLDIWDTDDNLLFSMRDNEWLVMCDPDDFECPPSGRSLILRVPKFSIRLTIEFRSLTQEQFMDLVRKDTLEGNNRTVAHLLAEAEKAQKSGNEFWAKAMMDVVQSAKSRSGVDPQVEKWITEALKVSEGKVVLCDLTADYTSPREVKITPTKIILPGNNIISGGLTISSRTAVSIR